MTNTEAGALRLRTVAVVAALLMTISTVVAEDIVNKEEVTKSVVSFYDAQVVKLSAARERVAANKITAEDQILLHTELGEFSAAKAVKASAKERLAFQKKVLATIDGEIADLKRGQWAGRGYAITEEDEIDVGTVCHFGNALAMQIERDFAVCKRSRRDPLEFTFRGFDHSKWVNGKSYPVMEVSVVSGIEVLPNGKRRLIVEPAKQYWPVDNAKDKAAETPSKSKKGIK